VARHQRHKREAESTASRSYSVTPTYSNPAYRGKRFLAGTSDFMLTSAEREFLSTTGDVDFNGREFLQDTLSSNMTYYDDA
jgi:hypothetical protein